MLLTVLGSEHATSQEMQQEAAFLGMIHDMEQAAASHVSFSPLIEKVLGSLRAMEAEKFCSPPMASKLRGHAWVVFLVCVCVGFGLCVRVRLFVLFGWGLDVGFPRSPF